MKKRVFVIFINLICMLLTGCAFDLQQEENVIAECEYEPLETSTLKDELSTYCSSYSILDLVENNSVRVLNQSEILSGYEVKLDEYFYNENTGTVIFKFLITDENGDVLTDEQMETLQDMLENGELTANPERSAGYFMEPVIQRDENNQVAWYIGGVVSAIKDGDKLSDSDISEIDLNYINVYVGDSSSTFYLPSYEYADGAIEFDASDSDSVLYARMTSSGLCIKWNISMVLNDFNRMIKSLPDGDDPELYGYDVYSDIRINMKNGDVYDVSNSDAYIEEETREESYLSSFSAIWDEEIDLNEVESLEIDGVKYYVK